MNFVALRGGLKTLSFERKQIIFYFSQPMTLFMTRTLVRLMLWDPIDFAA